MLSIVSFVGMPGSGKSTIGRQLAKRLGLPFVDSDSVIEQRIGGSIRTFFEANGEAAFRGLEEQVIRELLGKAPSVFATGGGAVMCENTRRALYEKSYVFYLRSNPEELFNRLSQDTKRPLLQVKDPLAQLRKLFFERDFYYRDTAHFIVETGKPSVSTLVNMILMQLELAGLVNQK